MRDFRKLLVWEKAYQLTLNIYQKTNAFPGHEMYGLTSQLRRAAVSVISNIAEGCARNTDADYARFLDMALGSASEVECQILLAKDLGYIGVEDWKILSDQVTEVKRMLAKFVKTLRGK